MITDMKRRIFLKGSLATGALGVALGAGLLVPQSVLAAWNKDAFSAKKVEDAIGALLGNPATETSDAVQIKAPDIAENGAVVPITVSTSMAAESISILAANNAMPLTSTFHLGEGAEGFISTRIKMGKTGDVIAVVKAGGKLYSARKSVKVTIGGCGG
ncbi:MAG: thiosulfate oxidation carrier protein SoxY [Gammaproteobacteria bacterium]|nr:thiosulfate oxidation carrier protein SoxY [Gammaproteobacteria bacterium]MBU1655638.1 thiosulfate oxidation carrier protein SoxY [Gammaproteobacteria bacterium]MBU1960291.1 thiosulfate oxidation carrier protein SoxY [Gammaproteobacteria bacterium]